MQAIIGKKKRIFFFIFLFIFLSTIQIPINKKYSDKSLFFPINFIEITGTSKIDKVNLLNDFNDFLGLNLFFLNKKKFEEILLKNKLIKNFTVSKKYPNTIQIKIDEINFLGILIRHNNKYFISDVFWINNLLTKSIVNDVIFAEKPYEVGIIQILIQ